MTVKVGVIGCPVEHSLSPLIHNTWITRCGIDAAYQAIAVTPEKLAQTVRWLVDTGYAGFNVTLPHKSAVMEYCDDIDALATAIGAVNTITIENGRLNGTNTDAFGFIENMRAQQPRWDSRARPALVLGAGGAARAAIFALCDSGVPRIILCNRHRARAEALASEAFCRGRVEVIDWADRQAALRQSMLLVNATSLGMAGQPELEIDLAAAREGCCVYDIVYRPLITPLLRQARKLNLPIVTGLGMLLHQARPAFQAWFGILPDIDADLVAKIEKAALS